MDRKVFMTFDDFVRISTELLEKTGLTLYRSESYGHPFVRVDRIDANAWRNSGLRALALLIGDQANDSRILGPNQSDVMRDARVGFVNVRYGGDDEFAIGATLYLADGSDTTKLVSRELNKLLKKYAHKDVIMSGSGTGYSGCYWTDAALASGKNWHLFLGTGVRKEGNKDPGYRPKPE
ncbi:hypothetical protein BLA6993_00282 [Burkholderia lata]|uniref:hypothetical protein n=1 Tax=Burkholderia lata (strain ATCC 17760 / DSM 23089 / LMG 22485 / NCIMB 9086 / R18194 / 383) TaxID=482957 RepID=UPI0014546D64|nr:hypothetical protein [Burkholderia lata]VWB09788.1 hypothetical protein BLA6993_00282 [Burkholderia lata]